MTSTNHAPDHPQRGHARHPRGHARRHRAHLVLAGVVAGSTIALSGVVPTPADAMPSAGGSQQQQAPAAASPRWPPRPATYPKVATTRDIPILMSDGVTLYANLYRPADASGKPVAKRFPVIVTLDPYNKNAPAVTTSYLVPRGYVELVVDVRGTGSSQGQWSAFGKREQRDGYEVVEWAHSHARRWSDGRIGMAGPSYMAINQLFTAAQHPAGLKALFPIVPGGDTYRDVVASGGEIDTGFIPLWLGLVTGAGLVPPLYSPTDPTGFLSVLIAHLHGAAGFQARLVLDSLTGGGAAYDGPFYATRSPLNVINRVRVPTFIVGGEYDLFQRSEPLLFQALQRDGVPTKLVFGPWNHLQASLGQALPAGSLPSVDALELRWFDHYVRGRPDPALNRDIAPVNYHEQVSHRWRTARHWLDRDIHARTWQPSGTATPGSPGVLVRGRPTSGADNVYPIPVTGLCTRSASQWTAGALSGYGPLQNPCDSSSAANDQAGTSFQTAPLRTPVHILGPIDAHLYASTTAHDGMLAVHVEDVAPDGTVSRLTGGWQVISLRRLDESRTVRRDGQILMPYHPFTKASKQLVAPGQVVPVDVEVFPTGAVIPAGHRLRVTVQAFDVPHLFPTVPELLDSVGVISLHHSATERSRIVLPVRGG
ncbi:MAG: CocE/NonD family hydrolase [Nocardioidaceae bacterium]